MKELVEVMAKALVEHPEEVSVIESEQNGETVIELKVAPLTWVRLLVNRAGSQKPFVLL